MTGGLAAIAHGSKRPLYDIDLEIHKEDAQKVRELFKDFITEDWNREIEGPDDEFDLWLLKLQIQDVPVDINQIEEVRIRTKDGKWVEQPEEMDRQLLKIEGFELPVQSKRSLIAYKRLLGRDTDLEDIQQIS